MRERCEARRGTIGESIVVCLLESSSWKGKLVSDRLREKGEKKIDRGDGKRNSKHHERTN